MEVLAFLTQLQKSLIIAKKNVRIYYLKGPVIIFGLIAPFFLFFAYMMGRNLTVRELLPGLLGMTTFFTSTSVGPAITPWEARSRTLERLVSTPIAAWTIFLGDAISSFLFGALFSVIPLSIAGFLGIDVPGMLVLGFGVVLASFCFASMSILLSSYPPTDIPATVMMVSSVVKFPLVFISGVFIPVENLPGWARGLAALSPLTYFTDLARHIIQGSGCYPIPLDLAMLAVFALLFLVAAIKLHLKSLPKRLA